MESINLLKQVRPLCLSSISAGYGILIGQNYAYGYPTWKEAIEVWYDEVNDYEYGRPDQDFYYSVLITHYTQVSTIDRDVINYQMTKAETVINISRNQPEFPRNTLGAVIYHNFGNTYN